MEQIRETINWNRCARAIDYYVSAGFKYIETPWRVEKRVVDATIPASATPFTLDCADPCKVLVGSAESGFLQLLLSDSLPRGTSYVSASPCFRDNESDDIHFKDFFKIELFSFDSESYRSLLRCAQEFFTSEGLRTIESDTDIGTDIIMRSDQIEVGSYGSRRVIIDGVKYEWSYGTGLAEPRFSQSLNKQLNV